MFTPRRSTANGLSRIHSPGDECRSRCRAVRLNNRAESDRKRRSEATIASAASKREQRGISRNGHAWQKVHNDPPLQPLSCGRLQRLCCSVCRQAISEETPSRGRGSNQAQVEGTGRSIRPTIVSNGSCVWHCPPTTLALRASDNRQNRRNWCHTGPAFAFLCYHGSVCPWNRMKFLTSITPVDSQ